MTTATLKKLLSLCAVALVLLAFALKFEWNTHYETVVVNTQQQEAKIKTYDFSQHLRVNFSGDGFVAVVPTDASGSDTGTSNECNQRSLYLCIQRITTGEFVQIDFFFIYQDTAGKPVTLKWSQLVPGEDSSIVEMKIERNNYLKVFIDNDLKQTYRYNSPLGVKAHPMQYRLEIDGEIEGTANSDLFTIRYPRSNNTIQKSFAILLIIAIGVCGLLLNKTIELRTRKNHFTLAFQILTISSSLTILSWFLSKTGLLGNADSFDRSGITYSPLVKFSDFFQVWSFIEFKQLYEVQAPDYPPLMVVVLKLLSYLLTPEVVLTFLISLAALTLLGFALESMPMTMSLKLPVGILLVTSSFPLLFAIDRGGLDLLVLPIVALCVIELEKGRYRSGSIVIGFLASIKVFPLIYVAIFLRQKKLLAMVMLSSLVALFSTIFASLVLQEDGVSEIFFLGEHLLRRSSGYVIESISANNSLWATKEVIVLAMNRNGFAAPAWIPYSWGVAVFVMTVSFLFWVFRRLRDTSVVFFVSTCLLILVPPLAGNYRLLYFYPAIWFIDNRQIVTDRHLRQSFVIAGGFLLSAHPIYYFGDTSINVGQVINPLLVIVLMLIVLFSERRNHQREPQKPEHGSN